MTLKSHHLNRREVLLGGGIALALPFLNSMTWATGIAGKKHPPKRMLISYIAYGVYDPNTPDGKSHEWSWFPRHDSGPLTLNKASAPFEPVKESLSYLRGLDHPGGYGLGGHSSGDVFGTGSDDQSQIDLGQHHAGDQRQLLP